jgi:hypothetical protein
MMDWSENTILSDGWAPTSAPRDRTIKQSQVAGPGWPTGRRQPTDALPNQLSIRKAERSRRRPNAARLFCSKRLRAFSFNSLHGAAQTARAKAPHLTLPIDARPYFGLGLKLISRYARPALRTHAQLYVFIASLHAFCIECSPVGEVVGPIKQ